MTADVYHRTMANPDKTLADYPNEQAWLEAIAAREREAEEAADAIRATHDEKQAAITAALVKGLNVRQVGELIGLSKTTLHSRFDLTANRGARKATAGEGEA